MKLLATIVLASLAGAATAQQPDQQPPEVTPLAENTFNLDWDGIHGRTYFIQFSTDLVDWQYMPVIESGQGVPLGYGFNCDGSRMFLRLHYTDQPTTTPHSDDFDGDGISNWDEIRPGGTGTDPFEWDTDGDGKSDYFADTGSNGVADGWELLYYGETGVVDPDADPDNDDQTNAQESWLGTSPNAHANTNDQDSDGLVDAVDAVPDDALINWPKPPVPHYVFVDIETPPGVGEIYPMAISEAGHVLAAPGGGTHITDWHSLLNYVWQPGTGTWDGPLSWTHNGVKAGHMRAADIDASGKIVGIASIEKDIQGNEGGTSVAYSYARVEWADASAHPQPAAGDRFSMSGGHYSCRSHMVQPIFAPDGAMLSMEWGGYSAFVDGESIEYSSALVNLGGDDLAPWLVQATEGSGIPIATNHFGRPGSGNLVTMTPVKVFQVPGQLENDVREMGVYLFQNGVRETVDSTERRRAEAVARMPDASGTPGAGRLLVTGTHTWIKQGGEWHQTRRRMSGWAVSPRGIILTGRKGESNKLWINGKDYTVEELCPQLSGNGRSNRIVDINDSGVMLCESVKPDGSKECGLLIPMDIVPDYNRDGKIDHLDRGKVTEDNPYRFWTNDDDDKTAENRKDSGHDIPATSPNDNNDLVVDGVRDLVDFFPLHIDLRGVKEVLPKNKYKYFLTQSVGAVKLHELPECILDRDADNNGPHAYLKNAAKAQALKAAPLKLVDSIGVELKGDILDSFFRGEGIVICEVVRDTVSPIKLEIRKNDGTPVAEVKFPFCSSEVEYMYRHVNLRAAGGGTGGRNTEMGEPANYPDDMPGLKSGKYFVFVHGYNVNGEQARGWHAEVFKRMWWSGSKARFVGVSWHGEESQGGAGMTSPIAGLIPNGLTPNYHANVINAFQTADDLASTLGGLNGEISIAAHSLGNMVVGLAIQDHGLQVQNYFLVDAAVAMEAYDAGETKQDNLTNGDWVNYDERLWASEWNKFPWPQNDSRKKLTWRGRLGNLVSNTNAYNFYSSEEEILNNATATHSTTFLGAIADDLVWDSVIGGAVLGEHTWVLQEILKGKGISGEVLGSTYGGWKFNYKYLTWPVNDPPPAALGGIYAGIYQSATYPFLEPTYVTKKLTPAETVGLAGQPQQLMAKPFFDPPPAGKTHAELLAQAFPARTNAAGRNAVGIFEDQGQNSYNFDMAAWKNGWFSTEKNEKRWRHSDIRDVGYLYTYKVYDKFKELGKLNQ